MLFLGGRSDVPTVDIDLPLDKAAHLFLYGVLGILLAIGWLRTHRGGGLPWPVLTVFLVGAADELNQRSVANRSSEGLDLVADVVGGAVGFAGWIRLDSKRRRIPE